MNCRVLYENNNNKKKEIKIIQIDKESISRTSGNSLQSGHSTRQYCEYLILPALLSRA